VNFYAACVSTKLAILSETVVLPLEKPFQQFLVLFFNPSGSDSLVKSKSNSPANQRLLRRILRESCSVLSFLGVLGNAVVREVSSLLADLHLVHISESIEDRCARVL
jgi:hypothetical protein